MQNTLQNILFGLLILICAGNVVNLFHPRKEQEQEEQCLSYIDATVHPNTLLEMQSKAFTALFGSHRSAKKVKRRQQHTNGNLWNLLLLLLLSAIILTPTFLQQVSWHSIKRRYERELKTYTFEKLYQPVLSPGGKSDNCLDPTSKYNCFERKLPSFLRRRRIFQNSTLFIFPAHLQNLFEEAGSLESSLNVMRYEWARYGSFKTFPAESPAMPIRLAAAGFYYIGPADRVQCFSCKMVYSGWTIEDVALDIHKRLSPRCKFLGENEDGNLSIHENNNGSQSNHTRTHAQSGPAPNTTDGLCVNMNSNRACFETTDYASEGQLHIDPVEDDFLATCKHPHYKELTVRLSSYSKWPCGDIQDPRCLAEAGFFYAGFSDCVRCFCCGLGLRNWEFGDGAWSEHERWSADCLYLTKRNRDSQNPAEDNDNQPPSSAANISSNTPAQRAITDAETNGQAIFEITESKHANDFEAGINNMNTLGNGPGSDCVTQVMQMGFDQAIVEEAVHACKGGTGKVFTCEELLDAILVIQNSQSTTSASPVPTNVVEPAAASKQPTISENFVDKTALERNERKGKVSISRYDNGLSIDCLREENRRLKDQLLCKICLDKEANMVLMPCGHMVSCETCAPALRKCPMCRKLVKDRVKTYLS